MGMGVVFLFGFYIYFELYKFEVLYVCEIVDMFIEC